MAQRIRSMPDEDLTQLIAQFAGGSGPASAELMQRIHPELKAIAERLVGRRRAAVTLQPTALVNEAYLRLAGKGDLAVSDRGHFFALAARVMRHVLVDAERRRARRGGLGAATVELAGGAPRAGARDQAALLDLDEALSELERRSERQARVVELRHFAGLEIEEVARVLGVSHATIERDWLAARAWLGARLTRRDGP